MPAGTDLRQEQPILSDCVPRIILNVPFEFLQRIVEITRAFVKFAVEPVDNVGIRMLVSQSTNRGSRLIELLLLQKPFDCVDFSSI